jgi:ABC-type glutathione transport system ATPase component
VTAQQLRAEAVTIRFPGGVRPAIRSATCALSPGDVHALVGQSGSGKSTLLRALSRLVDVSEGTIRLGDRDITHLTGKDLTELRRTVQIVFQDPYTSLSPTHTVGWLLEEALAVGGTPAEKRAYEAAALLEQVGLPGRVAESRPKRLSGGERQRVAIARALCVHPGFLLCDEVTSALDVVSQVRIMGVLMRLRDDLGVGLAIATHDLSLAARFCSSIQVLWNGEIVEEGSTERVLVEPKHPYTQELVAAAKW